MAAEVLIADPMGVLLADIDVVPTASWILNDVGDASFDMSLNDAKAVEEYLQFGNILIINHDTLPSWVGFIEASLGREWNYDTITIRALSAECIFDQRIVYPEMFRGTNGAILKTMLDNLATSSEGGIRLYPGSIYMGGKPNYYPLIGRCREVVDRLARKGKCDWSVTHKIEQGRVKLYANLYKGERGTQTGKVLDARTTEAVSPFYTEEGEIWNHVVFMKPLTEEGEVKICAPQRNEKSIGRYGLRMYLGEANAEEEEALIWQARAWLYDHAFPRALCSPSIINVDDIFEDVDLGNIFRWENHEVGFEGPRYAADEMVRLTGFEFNYGGDKVAAVVESAVKPFDITELFNE